MYRNFVKRILDIIISGIALLCFCPIILVLIAILMIANRYSAFFVQERPGKDGKIFKLVKFKTMTEKTDSDGNLLPEDKRLTKIGTIIRSTSLDELPLLWNVL